MKYQKRAAEETVRRYLKAFPVIGLTGPRQSGKSTLLMHLLKDYEYVTFDDIRKVQMFEDDPMGFIDRYSQKTIFDEVQQVPNIFGLIKLAVDQNRQKYGNFVLTGSSQFAFLKSASESLAGRIGLVSLLPFEYQEIPKKLRKESIFRGGYPELVLREYLEADAWFASYVDTYLNKDLRQLINIGDMRDFRRFILLLAAQVGQTVDFTHYAKDIGVSVPTIKRWFSVLEASYILFLLPPFHKNRGKRIIKSPKMYFFDTGLVSYLTGIQTFDQYSRGPLAGPLFENYVISEIYKKHLHRAETADLYYLRTYEKAEIDLIVDRRTHCELIEIKKSATFKPKMIETLKSFRQPEDKAYLLYQGEEDHYQGISILPVEKFFR